MTRRNPFSGQNTLPPCASVRLARGPEDCSSPRHSRTAATENTRVCNLKFRGGAHGLA